MTLGKVLCWIEAIELPASGLSSVTSVGIGLYLGLAVVQVVGSGQLARLKRKSLFLRNLVHSNDLDDHQDGLRKIDADLLSLELSLESLSGKFLYSAFFLLAMALIGLIWTTLSPDQVVRGIFAVLYVAYCVVLPVVVFTVASAIIRHKCRSVAREIRSCETEALTAISMHV